MKNPTCPLASPPDIEFGELTAEAARNQVAAFPGLAYTPAEAETVRELIREIKEHAAMGFSWINHSNDLSEQLRASLQAKGFQVQTVHSYHLQPGSVEFMTDYQDRFTTALKPSPRYPRLHEHTFLRIIWETDPVPFGVGEFASHEEMLADANQKMEKARDGMMAYYTKAKERYDAWVAASAPEQPSPVPVQQPSPANPASSGGCLILLCPLAILGGTLYGISTLF